MLRLALALMILLFAVGRDGVAQLESRKQESRASNHRPETTTEGAATSAANPASSEAAGQRGRGRRGDPASRPDRRDDPERVIRFSAASSTTEIVEEIVRRFEAATGYDVLLTFGSSGTLAQQIMRGSEADLFLSANESWADKVSEPNLRGGSRVSRRITLLTNSLVVVVPAGSTLKIKSLEDLLDPSIERLAVADPDTVPAGIYAREALNKVGLWEKLRGKILPLENVRTTLIHVAQGGAQAGIVYRTDAAISDEVRIELAIDPNLHGPIRYPLLLMRRGERHPGARLLFEFLSAATVYERYGFGVAAGEERAVGARPGTTPVEPAAVGFFTAPEWAAIKLSCLVGLGVVVVSLPVAIALGFVLARYSFRGKALVEILVNLPLVLPPVVTGYLLLLTFNADAPVGRALRRYLDINIAYNWKGLVVAAAVMSFPLMVRAIRLGFQSVDSRLETAARTLGAGRMGSFLTVSLPLARHGIIAGCVLAFARSLGEFGATVMLVSQQESTRTIALLIYHMRDQVGGLDEIWRVLVISLVLAGAALGASEYLERRGLRRELA